MKFINKWTLRRRGRCTCQWMSLFSSARKTNETNCTNSGNEGRTDSIGSSVHYAILNFFANINGKGARRNHKVRHCSFKPMIWRTIKWLKYGWKKLVIGPKLRASTTPLHGHVARLPEEDPAHRILSSRHPEGWTMQKGRPRASWLRCYGACHHTCPTWPRQEYGAVIAPGRLSQTAQTRPAHGRIVMLSDCNDRINMSICRINETTSS